VAEVKGSVGLVYNRLSNAGKSIQRSESRLIMVFGRVNRGRRIKE
jgi:hypothetical protein